MVWGIILTPEEISMGAQLSANLYANERLTGLSGALSVIAVFRRVCALRGAMDMAAIYCGHEDFQLYGMKLTVPPIAAYQYRVTVYRLRLLTTFYG